jgi:hypothetical protein
MLNAPLIREAIDALVESGEVVRVAGPAGAKLLDVSDGLLPPEDSPAPPRLLGMWDNVLLSYADRSRVIPPEHRTLVARVNGDLLPTLLVDGYVAGLWRLLDGRIEARAFESLPDDAVEALQAEAARLLPMLMARDPKVYGRYNHWWEKMPKGGTLVLAKAA